MAQHGHRAARDHRQCLHVHGEAIDLPAVNLVAREGAREYVDADIFGLDVARSFIELLIEWRHLNLATLTSSAKGCIFAKQAAHMEAVVDQFFECHAIVTGDSSKADMDFVFVILRADVERRAWFGH